MKLGFSYVGYYDVGLLKNQKMLKKREGSVIVLNTTPFV